MNIFYGRGTKLLYIFFSRGLRPFLYIHVLNYVISFRYKYKIKNIIIFTFALDSQRGQSMSTPKPKKT